MIVTENQLVMSFVQWRTAAPAAVMLRKKKKMMMKMQGRMVASLSSSSCSHRETIVAVSSSNSSSTKRRSLSSSSSSLNITHHDPKGPSSIHSIKEMQKKHKTTPATSSMNHVNVSLAALKQRHDKEIQALPEYRASLAITEFLKNKVHPIQQQQPLLKILPPTTPLIGCRQYQHVMSTNEIRISLDAALAAFCLHVNARIAALVGKGFYTIGPCGEETLSSAAMALHPEDSVALHYRHVGINLARQLLQMQPGSSSSNSNSSCDGMEELLLDRARGYTVSRLDPVTGGVHCSIGSSSSSFNNMNGSINNINNNYLVTSTLASQCPPAVGRALGYALVNKVVAKNDCERSEEKKERHQQQQHQRPVSFVTIGDGSVHNHHFWSAFQLARHAHHKRIKCPIVFGISDNGLSISYSTNGYCDSLFGGSGGHDDPLVPLFRVDNANDMMEVYSTTKRAMDYSRTHSAPCVLLYSGLVRRFGHAATDRQSAYLSLQQIQAMEEMTTLEQVMTQAVNVHNAMTWSELFDRFNQIQDWTRLAFEQASGEDKVTRQEMLDLVSAKPVAVPRLFSNINTATTTTDDSTIKPQSSAAATDGQATTIIEEKPQVMRKHMTRVMEEVMEKDKSIVYIGEDVQHGGYYLVTQGLVDKFPGRVIDFPPDETSLLGAAMGFAQVGLLPIVEIPYAKYLDCAADMFYEIAIMNWLSAGQRPNGMVIRLQGFDRGLFGGNFHTHNMLSHMPPGVDVVCYSNGEDYVRGFRHAIAQAKAGRVVMSVDCTDLLNKRHLIGNDRAWERTYPGADSTMMSFDDIRCHGTSCDNTSLTRTKKHAIVTYGNGVVTALQSRAFLDKENEIDILDCPYLSDVPHGLKEVLPRYDKVLFADICKEGPGSNVLSNTAIALHRDGLLPNRSNSDWAVVSAPRCYNPLGSTVTFLNVDDIVTAYLRLVHGTECVLDS